MKAVIGVLVAILVLGAGWWYYTTQMTPAADQTPNTTNNTTNTTNNANTPTPSGQGSTTVNINIDASVNNPPTTANVELTSSGFSQKTVTIKKGGTVTWANETAGNMWIASASHPTHTAYDGTALAAHCAAGSAPSFDQCKNGTSYSFTFTKTGTWNYHNHSTPSQFGSVVVVE